MSDKNLTTLQSESRIYTRLRKEERERDRKKRAADMAAFSSSAIHAKDLLHFRACQSFRQRMQLHALEWLGLHIFCRDRA
ncbi:hypothetical protein ACLOJK_032651 [Asimina triloba]